MASKEIVVTAPFIVMLYDRAFRLPTWRALTRPGGGRGWLYTALWILCLGSFAVFSLGARGETAGYASNIHWYEYLYTQCWAIARYLRLVAWPTGLAIDYGFLPIHGLRGVPGALLLTAFGGATLFAWTRVERLGWFAFLGSWFFLLLAPSSSVVPIASEIAAERRIYLALAAVLVLIVVGAESARRKFFASAPPRALVAGAAALALVLAAATALRSETYRSAESLWRSAAAATPDNPRALGNYGWALYKQPAPKLAEAESAYAKAMARDSTCHFGCLQYATVLSAARNYAAAVPLLERVIARDEGDAQAQREMVFAQRELGLVLMRLGDYPRAITYLEPLAQAFPEMDHLVVLGVAYLAAGRRDDAISAFKRIAALEGGSAQMQQLSAQLTGAAAHPESLDDLKQYAFNLASGWM
jgi:tetratricopeptide (TPR) repeat protein